jgi:hypothetical protein
MSVLLARVQSLAKRGEVGVSRHGLGKMTADDILLDDVVAGVGSAILIEEYPEHAKGPSVLVLQRDGQNRPIHIVWGIAKYTTTPTVLVTALST